MGTRQIHDKRYTDIFITARFMRSVREEGDEEACAIPNAFESPGTVTPRSGRSRGHKRDPSAGILRAKNRTKKPYSRRERRPAVGC